MKSSAILITFAATIYGCGQAETAPSAENIAGLKIGMTLEDARLQLPKINQNLKIDESRDPYWNSAPVITARDPTEIIIIKFTETNRQAYFIGRSVTFQKGKRPLRAEIKKELLAKYGEPTGANDGQGADGANWAKSSPKQIQEPNPYNIRGCGYGPVGETSWSAAPGAAPFYLRPITRECDLLIEAIWGTEFGERQDVAASLGVAITAFPIALADPKHPSHLDAANEQRRIEEARKNKPKI